MQIVLGKPDVFAQSAAGDAWARTMADIDLKAHIGTALQLEEPFWIASSHFTEKDSVLKQWKELEPAALTLKTCTSASREGQKRSIRRKTLSIAPRYGRSYYCDGPKSLELHSYEQSADLLAKAKELLPKSLVGISVLATEHENFDDLRVRCAQADFCELNLKYSMRTSAAGEDFLGSVKDKWAATLEIVQRFLGTFNDKPVFIKISRELTWLPGTSQCGDLIAKLTKHGKAGLIVANSLKADLAEVVYENQETELSGGVLMGDALYDSTLTLIEAFRDDCREAGIPIVATGGMVDEQQVLMALRAGADAVQLCTAFEYNKLGYYRTLRSALEARIRWRGLKNFADFLERIRIEGIASIYSMPFMYYSSFWSDDVQKEIQLDMKYSDRMDAVVMSGNTLLQKWQQPLRNRIRAHKSLQFYLPNPEGEMFAAVQKAWGISEQRQLDARKARAEDTRKRLEQWFAEDADTSVEAEKERPEWGAYFYDQCPFYSFYIFDDKVYLAQYPFMRPDRLGSPVYVFFRSSPEYDRLDRELQALRAANAQTTLPHD
ncbi:MAG: nitronate monooxygenase [Bryobacteraceae bacterium]|nr:nitronate monooxygenase [Bryobacteraceae bacterium]